MKSTSHKVLLVWIVQILFYFGTVQMTEYKYALIFTIMYVTIHLLFLFIPDKRAFVLFIIGTILSVFYLFYEAWLYLWTTSEQLSYIVFHFFAASNFFLIYISTYLLKQVVHENKRLTEQLIKLEQYIAGTKLLTKQEFVNRGILLEAAMKRRDETGVLIYFDFSSFNTYTRDSVRDHVASLLLETVRNNFDLVGKYDDEKLVILLQNTNAAGAEIVMNRLHEKMKTWLTNAAIKQIQMKQEQIGKQESPSL
ncbi:GGDEF domain-containing protein [Bacillus sp. CGMCC 1.60114]|uniref:GGDEF domain-containing protein n=1 Tax=unclassified Bacillus (in: firmicutes) TaxID=185979 RepID=UPI003634E1D1